jgi:hypothetical protein
MSSTLHLHQYERSQQIAADGREFGVELVQQVVHYSGELG